MVKCFDLSDTEQHLCWFNSILENRKIRGLQNNTHEVSVGGRSESRKQKLIIDAKRIFVWNNESSVSL